MTIEANFNKWKKFARICKMQETAKELSTHKFHRIKTMINSQLNNKLSFAFDKWKTQKHKTKNIEKGLASLGAVLSKKVTLLLVCSFAKL